MPSILNATTTSGLVTSADNSGSLQLQTNNGTTAVTIDTSQNVGVGTNSPSYNLHVSNANNPVIAVTDTTNPTTGYFQAIDSRANLGTLTNHPLAFATNDTERMRITSGGDVLIGGTTSLANGALTAGDNSTTRPLVLRGAGGVDGTYINGIVFYPWNTTEVNVIRTSVSGSAGGSGFQFMVSDGFGSPNITESFRINRTSCTVIGSLSKGSGSFKIDHPLPELSETHHLVHSFIEGPQADLIYRGKAQLVDGRAVINIDEAVGMTEGTFVLLNRDVQCFTSNETDWDAVRGSVNGNLLTIECQNNQSTATISWLVIGERQDKHMYETDWTDEDGKVIVEPLKNPPVEGTE